MDLFFLVSVAIVFLYTIVSPSSFFRPVLGHLGFPGGKTPPCLRHTTSDSDGGDLFIK